MTTRRTTTTEHEGSRPPAVRRPALVYFAKAPRPGLVKTRLCPPLTPAEAAGLYRGFLTDVLRPVAGAVCYAFVWPADALSEVECLAAAGVQIRPQVGADLWQRMTACFRELFDEGHDAVVLRNTDSPDLPDSYITDAIAACAADRVVLGPDQGGGYVLVGLTAPPGALFAPGLDSDGAEGVLAATRARIEALGLEAVELDEAPDVDSFDDLLDLWRLRDEPRV